MRNDSFGKYNEGIFRQVAAGLGTLLSAACTKCTDKTPLIEKDSSARLIYNSSMKRLV